MIQGSRNVNPSPLSYILLLLVNVIGAAFSMGKLYNTEPAVKWEVLSAMRQVVAGLKYDMTIKVYFEDGPGCEISDVGVWDHFGFLKVTDTNVVTSRQSGACVIAATPK
jgi:hypothetical protein